MVPKLRDVLKGDHHDISFRVRKQAISSKMCLLCRTGVIGPQGLRNTYYVEGVWRPTLVCV